MLYASARSSRPAVKLSERLSGLHTARGLQMLITSGVVLTDVLLGLSCRDPTWDREKAVSASLTASVSDTHWVADEPVTRQPHVSLTTALASLYAAFLHSQEAEVAQRGGERPEITLSRSPSRLSPSWGPR